MVWTGSQVTGNSTHDFGRFRLQRRDIYVNDLHCKHPATVRSGEKEREKGANLRNCAAEYSAIGAIACVANAVQHAADSINKEAGRGEAREEQAN